MYRSNASIYSNGKITAADCSASQPYFDIQQSNPLVAASLAFSLKQSFSSATPSNRFSVGMMIVTWHVRFVSIKLNGITQ